MSVYNNYFYYNIISDSDLHIIISIYLNNIGININDKCSI